MNYENLEFMQAYYDNIGKQNFEAIEASSVGKAMIKVIEPRYKEVKEVYILVIPKAFG